MRCSCARSRLAALAVPPVLFACAAAPPAPDAGKPFYLEGTLSVEGPDPFGRTLVLVDGEGIGWRLERGQHEHELSLLGGHEMRMFCRGISERGAGAIAIARYELLPVDGYVPLYGIVRVRPGSIRIEAAGTPIDLHGPLSEALAGFDGHAVWAWGERGSHGAMTVEGYVVMGMAAPAP